MIKLDYFQTHTQLRQIIDRRPQRGMTLYDALFAPAPVVFTEAKQLIWDEIPFENGIPTPAPFTRPCGAPLMRRADMIRANSINFPYIDIGREACCDMLQARLPGASQDQSAGIGMANLERWLGDATAGVVEDWKTRLAVMASEIIRTGSFTVSGPDIQSQVIDFDRDPELTIALTGPAAWNNPTGTPVADMEAWVDLMLAKSGYYGSDWFVGPEAWAYLRKNEDFKKIFQSCTASINEAGNFMLNPIGRKVTDIQLQGTFKNHSIYLVTGSYKDLDGITKEFFPKDGVAMFGNFSPIRAFGMIKDKKANFQAMEYFLSEKDECKVPEIELQSAPLLIVGNPNAMLFAKVTEA